MDSKPIDRAIAKRELARINVVLRSPRLLIGGLAVQQYYAARISRDIDLVCDFQTTQLLLDTLYPSNDWKVIDKQNDEYRPSFRITHKVDDFGAIIFGPKISEREPYAHIDWARLMAGAKPFAGPSGPLENILVPSAHALAYTKFISFLGRHAPNTKVQADLKDLVDLSNTEDFSVSLFYDLLRMSRAFEEITRNFRVKAAQYQELLARSCLNGIAAAFVSPSQLAALGSESSMRRLEVQREVLLIEPEVLKIKTAEEFLTAIDSNRVLELSSDTFDLSTVRDRYMDHVRWDKRFDGLTLVIRNVKNLTIKGAGIAGTRLVVSPKYADVLRFESCEAIRLSQITIGHDPPGYCTGGVVAVSDSENIAIDNCALFGSGVEGLTLRAVKTFVMVDSEIFDCTYGIATMQSCKDVNFSRSVFRNNREFWGIAIRDCERIEFLDCLVRSNLCPDDLFQIVSSSSIRFVRGVIADNRCLGLGSIVTNDTDVQPAFVPVDRHRIRRT